MHYVALDPAPFLATSGAEGGPNVFVPYVSPPEPAATVADNPLWESLDFDDLLR
jgi:hypothetical protein